MHPLHPPINVEHKAGKSTVFRVFALRYDTARNQAKPIPALVGVLNHVPLGRNLNSFISQFSQFLSLLGS